MSHFAFYPLKTFLVLASAIGTAPLNATAKQPAAKLILLPTAANRDREADNKSPRTNAPGDQPLALLVLFDEKTVKTNSGPTHLGLVRSLSHNEQSGEWRDLRFAQKLNAIKSDGALRTANQNQAGRQTPEVIRMQSPQVVRAWADVQQAIAENEKLSNPLPEPYFARAEILTLAGDFDSALRDYLHAADIAGKSRESLVAYSAYFERLLEALDSYDKNPRPPALGRSNAHFSVGMQNYYDGDLTSANWHFTNAIALENDVALYWYFRALTSKRLGDDLRAKHDVLIGTHVESRYGDSERDRVAQGLTRVQGDLRLWLERYRLGDPTQQVLR